MDSLFTGHILENGSIRKMESSFIIKSGSREALGTEEDGDFPSGSYNGTFREDYEYVAGLRDLEECNGMTL
jgi:hypothetical protein